MNIGSFKFLENKIVLRFNLRICETAEELLESSLFKEVLTRSLDELSQRNSFLLNIFDGHKTDDQQINDLIKTFQFLSKMPGTLVPNVVKGSQRFLKDPHLLNDFVEYLYNYWRRYDRFLICDSTQNDLDKSSYRTFNASVGELTNLIRGVYRDIQENIIGHHPRIYRQVSAGAEVATISIDKQITFPSANYNKLNKVPMIRQVLLHPPLILNPPMNKRSGKFQRIPTNPLDVVDINREEWLCYPAKVGELVILIYFHNKFLDLGFSLCNLFQLAEDEDLNKKPDAVYVFGVAPGSLNQFGDFPTVFYDDEANDLLVGAVPNDNQFGYFGYLKKMVLTLHNIIMMKKGRLPFHGALVRIILKGNRDVTILFIGDTGAGKSETLEAFRELGYDKIQDIIIIADDMGSLDIDGDGNIIGYGTEIGAFLRLDDLQPGYALGQIDRAIIMSANQVNARIILPVTSYDNVIKGRKIDYILYANNYDQIDDEHPIIERVTDVEKALNIFREGTVMSKGTTTTTGLVHSYFANVFGPPQYKEIHEGLAHKFFNAFFKNGVFVGQMRTRLGLVGAEREGPIEAAKELLEVLQK